jgi:hypothetical protein
MLTLLVSAQSSETYQQAMKSLSGQIGMVADIDEGKAVISRAEEERDEEGVAWLKSIGRKRK